MELLTQLLNALWAQDFETLANPSMIGMLYFVLFTILFLENGLLYRMDHAWAALPVDPAVYGLLMRVILGLRIFGRIAFPVYCFLLVQGFLHTRHYGVYLRNLILFADLGDSL